MRFINVFLIFSLVLHCSAINVLAVQKGGVEYTIPIEYSLLNEKELNTEAEHLFSDFENSQNDAQKKVLLDKLLWDYSLLGEIDKENPLYFTRLGIIYDNLKKDRYAKSNFFRSQNLIPNYPYSAYSFGNFYYERKDFRKALKEYTKAYNDGYNNHYDTLCKLASIYEKLGDFSNSIFYYKKALELKNSEELNAKIIKLEELLLNNNLYNQSRGINR